MDIRYRQRFVNYSKALEQLEKGLRYFEQEQEHKELAEVIRTSVIKSFEFSFELAWNLMKDYAIYQGIPNVAGSRDAIREAFSMGLISEEMQFTWKEMILSRNQSSHTYNESTAEDIFRKIKEEYMNQSSHTYNESTAEDIFRKIKEEYMDAFYEFWQTMKTRQDE